jgi:hypothetical protein
MALLAFKLKLIPIIQEIVPYINKYGTQYVSHLPNNLMLQVANIVSILTLAFIALYFIVSIFLIIARCRFVKFNSFKTAFQFKEIIRDISEIGWGKYLTYLVLIGIALFILSLIGLFLMNLGVMGIVFSFLIVFPFSVMFFYNSMALIYIEGENQKYLDENKHV